MKKIKNIYKVFIMLFLVVACDEELRDLSFADNIDPPSNILATYDITQDNTGYVTITPSADGAVSFKLDFGDASDSETISQGQSVSHTYIEGSYNVTIEASNINGDKKEETQPLVVSFKAPENVVTTIENDAVISKQVNITATADYAMNYEFYSGESGVSQPVATINIGESLSYVYANSGIYSIKIIVKGGAIETAEYNEDFEVTEILAPITAATSPPERNSEDVVSIFSEAYTDVALNELPTSWSAGNFEALNLNNDNVWKLTSLDFLGMVTNYGNGIDVSSMETLHIDYWVPESVTNELFVKIVNTIDGGEDIESLGATVSGSWQSIDLDMTGFDGGNLANKQKITQILIDSDGEAGVVYIDNFYFYKQPSGVITSSIQDFEGAEPVFTVFGNIANIEVIDNPDPSGVNITGKVAKMTKTSGSEEWAGSFFDTSSPLDLITYNKMIIKTWSPKSGATVRLKIENSANNQEFFEVDATTSKSNEWEELSFDLSNAQSFTYDRIVVFFDFGNPGDDAVYYYDEFNIINDSGGSSLNIFQDFEGTAPAFTVFGNITDVEVIDNPDATGANTTQKVAKMIKTSGSEVWAGSFFDIDPAIDLVSYSKMSIKTWSPKSGATVRLKIENSANNQEFFEIDAITSTQNTWEELTFDLSAAQSFTYDRVVLFFDFGNAGDDSVYYYDEFALTN